MRTGGSAATLTCSSGSRVSLVLRMHEVALLIGGNDIVEGKHLYQTVKSLLCIHGTILKSYVLIL